VVGKSWDVFTKRLLIEKHISGMMCENLGEARTLPFSPSALQPTPTATTVFNTLVD